MDLQVASPWREARSAGERRGERARERFVCVLQALLVGMVYVVETRTVEPGTSYGKNNYCRLYTSSEDRVLLVVVLHMPVVVSRN